jgi:type III restriction enzyme
MKDLQYQQKAIKELTEKTIDLLNLGEKRKKLIFEAPTGSGKTVMASVALSEIVEELKNRSDSRYQEVAFIWIAPNKLHEQSYFKIKHAFGETRRLRPVMYDELDHSEGCLHPSEILFVNWESINKENAVIMRESEQGKSLCEITQRTQEQGTPIVVIIDEEHMFWSKTADRSAQVLARINPAVEIRISATPKSRPDEKVTVHRKEVIRAGMIKEEVVLNPDLKTEGMQEGTLDQYLVKTAVEKRNQLAEAYRELGVNINPLLLIQLPNDTKQTLTAEDTAVVELVTTYLNMMYDINTANGKLAVWLAGEKVNLDNIEQPDNLTEVLLFKQAIALGWDCPRAAVLLIFRKLNSDTFTIQTVGRILRMPEQHFYTDPVLNRGYVYTDLSKDKIQIVAEDMDYLHANVLYATRRKELVNVALPSVYSERLSSDRNRLGSDFRKVLFELAEQYFKLEVQPLIFSFAELAALKDEDDYTPLPETDDHMINNNRDRVKQTIRLDVKNINIEIPRDVHFQNEVGTIEVGDNVKFARTTAEIDRVFVTYIASRLGAFERAHSTDKLAGYLLEMMADYFGIFETDAKKVILYHQNKPKFDDFIAKALARYAVLLNKRKQAAQKRAFKQYVWKVPEERLYDDETNRCVGDVANHALLPFVRLNNASKPEKDFEAYLEANSEYIDWWYKNGDSGRQHYSIEYVDIGNEPSLFFIDFVVRMKNGNIYLFDTKSAGSDMNAANKHNAFIDYMKAHPELHIKGGGVIVQEGDNWRYSPLKISNTHDTVGWDCFYPHNA